MTEDHECRVCDHQCRLMVFVVRDLDAPPSSQLHSLPVHLRQRLYCLPTSPHPAPSAVRLHCWQHFLLLPEITLPTDMMGQSAQELSLPWEWPLMPDWWQMAYWTRLLSLLSCGSALAPGGSLGMHFPTLSSLCGSSLDNSPWVAAFPSLSHVSTLQPSRTGVSWGYFPYNYYSESLSQRQLLEVSTLW